MVEEKTWEEFRKIGLLWWTNRILHLFGWAIVIEYGEVIRAYPARCKFRGFSEDLEEAGFSILSQYLKNNIEKLAEEARSSSLTG